MRVVVWRQYFDPELSYVKIDRCVWTMDELVKRQKPANNVIFNNTVLYNLRGDENPEAVTVNFGKLI